MPYTPYSWANDVAGATPITAARLNAIETGIDDAHTNADAATASLATILGASAGWDVTNGYTTDKDFDPETAVVLEVARVLGTLIDALIAKGIIQA